MTHAANSPKTAAGLKRTFGTQARPRLGGFRGGTQLDGSDSWMVNHGKSHTNWWLGVAKRVAFFFRKLPLKKTDKMEMEVRKWWENRQHGGVPASNAGIYSHSIYIYINQGDNGLILPFHQNRSKDRSLWINPKLSQDSCVRRFCE